MEALQQAKLDLAAREQQQQFLKNGTDDLKNEIGRQESALSEMRDFLQKELDEKALREQQIRQTKETILAAEKQLEDQRQQMDRDLAEKDRLNRSHREFFDKRDELSEHKGLMDKECMRLSGRLEQIENRRETQISHLWEEYEITPDQLEGKQAEEGATEQSLHRQLTEVKDDIRRLGNVNVNAIEEYKEVKERHTFLSAQYEDLTKAADTLQGIIAELDQGMRRQFAEKFKAISLEFDKAFKQLFGGGKGTLELMEDADILEAGIRIISQPPGKKLQNMMQLSGGEKALTAIALLFAIQALKPSPFCLLDEIEAALDDSNVTRFAQYLHKLTKNTQFIVITHRRGTMTAADRLYGITMQEKGVSTLVSVNLIEAKLDA